MTVQRGYPRFALRHPDTELCLLRLGTVTKRPSSATRWKKHKGALDAHGYRRLSLLERPSVPQHALALERMSRRALGA
jgi:hypothetical protein